MRVERLFTYSGPDCDTLAVLERHASAWRRNPYLFWAGIQHPFVERFESQADVLSFYLRLQRANA